MGHMEVNCSIGFHLSDATPENHLVWKIDRALDLSLISNLNEIVTHHSSACGLDSLGTPVRGYERSEHLDDCLQRF
jgi:hypothetical protein